MSKFGCHMMTIEDFGCQHSIVVSIQLQCGPQHIMLTLQAGSHIQFDS